jgi:hypothetical protein
LIDGLVKARAVISQQKDAYTMEKVDDGLVIRTA